MSFSYAPDLVIQKKRKRARRDAIDPCLGYYMRSPSPSAGQDVHTEPSASEHTTMQVVGPSHVDGMAIGDVMSDCVSRQHYLPRGTSEFSKRSESSPPDQLTVEAFLQWSAAAEITPIKPPRKKLNYAQLHVEKDGSPPKTAVPPVIRRYKRRRVVAREASSSPQPGTRRKNQRNRDPRFRKRIILGLSNQRKSSEDDVSTRHPLQFSSSQTPPRTPGSHKWRIIDPHKIFRSMLCANAARPKEKRCTRWRADLPTHTHAVPVQRPSTPRPYIQSSSTDQLSTTNPLRFIPLEEHEDLMTIRLSATRTVSEEQKVGTTAFADDTIVSTLMSSPFFRNATSSGNVELAGAIGFISDAVLHMSDKSDRPAEDVYLAGHILAPKFSRQRAATADTVIDVDISDTSNPGLWSSSDDQPLLTRSSQALPVAGDKLPDAADASTLIPPSPDRRLSNPVVPAKQEGGKLLKPIGSFLDEFREIARIATQMHTKIPGGDLSTSTAQPTMATDSQHVNDHTTIIPTSSRLSRRFTERCLSRAGSSLFTALNGEFNSFSTTKNKIKPRYALSHLSKTSQFVPKRPDEDLPIPSTMDHCGCPVSSNITSCPDL